MLTPTQALALMRMHGAFLIGGHFVFKSGHSTVKVDLESMLNDRALAEQLCEPIARYFLRKRISFVVGVANGGNLVAETVADLLSKEERRIVYLVRTQKAEGGKFSIDPGYEHIIRGKVGLICEDVLTSGGAMKKAREAVDNFLHDTIYGATILNRGRVDMTQIGGLRELYTFVDHLLPKWSAEQCPYCAQGKSFSNQAL